MVQNSENTDKLNNLLKFYSDNNIMIIFKRTKYYQGSGKNKRVGRFNFNRLEHKNLSENDGYYLLFIYDNNIFKFGKLLKAKNIKFKRLISWKKLKVGDSD